MYKDVVIGGKTIPMLANAATPKRAYELFGKDYLDIIGKELDAGKIIGLAEELGFVMAARAADKDMQKLSEADFDAWLEEFDLGDMVEAANDIIELYVHSTTATISPK